jgi:hypothetical protein
MHGCAEIPDLFRVITREINPVFPSIHVFIYLVLYIYIYIYIVQNEKIKNLKI